MGHGLGHMRGRVQGRGIVRGVRHVGQAREGVAAQAPGQTKLREGGGVGGQQHVRDLHDGNDRGLNAPVKQCGGAPRDLGRVAAKQMVHHRARGAFEQLQRDDRRHVAVAQDHEQLAVFDHLVHHELLHAHRVGADHAAHERAHLVLDGDAELGGHGQDLGRRGLAERDHLRLEVVDFEAAQLGGQLLGGDEDPRDVIDLGAGRGVVQVGAEEDGKVLPASGLQALEQHADQRREHDGHQRVPLGAAH